VSRKYLIETYGCQMNYHDSEQMAGLLEAAGYDRTDDDRDADVVVINTCSVREHAEEKLYTRLGELRVLGEETGRDPLVAVAGCVAQQEGAALLKRSSQVDVVVGTRRTRMLPMLVAQAGTERRPQVDLGAHDNVAFPFGLTRRADAVRAWVTIIEGCNEYCSFCVVPYTRGHERMRPKADILAEVRAAAEQGLKEVQLLGQIVNHYQAPDEPDCDFAGLLEAVHEVRGIERIRFASPHPRHVTERLVAAIRDLPKVCKHLHLPVQSGSTRVLTAMRRRYSRDSYLALVARLRAEIPALAVTTDMIVGFPGETAEEFDDTLSLTAAVRYHSMFSFKYSERPNTLAAKRHQDTVPEDEKTRRIVALQQLQREIQLELHEAMVGETFEVLGQVEAAVESPFVAGEVARCVADVDRAARAGDRALHIAEPSVGPFEISSERSSTAGVLDHVLQAGLVEAVEAGEPVGEHARAGLDVAGRIVADRLLREPRHDAQMRIDRMAVTGRDGDDEREFVRRTAPRLSGLLAPLIGVVDLDIAGELVHRVPLQHHLKQFLLDEPRRIPFDVELAGQFERRDVVFRCRDQMHRQEPLG